MKRLFSALLCMMSIALMVPASSNSDVYPKAVHIAAGSYSTDRLFRIFYDAAPNERYMRVLTNSKFPPKMGMFVCPIESVIWAEDGKSAVLSGYITAKSVKWLITCDYDATDKGRAQFTMTAKDQPLVRSQWLPADVNDFSPPANPVTP